MSRCKICDNEVYGKRIYCSNKCKFSDIEYNKRRAPKNKNVDGYAVKCIQTGKVFKDITNHSGCLTRYSKSVLNKSYDKSDWIQFELPKSDLPFIKCPICDWTTKDIDNKSGQYTVHILTHGNSILDFCEIYPHLKHLFDRKLKLINAKIEMRSHADNNIQCLLCGEKMRKVTNSHLRNKHSITNTEYKLKFNLENLSSISTRNKLKTNIFQNEKMMRPTFQSNQEKEVSEFLASLGINITTQRRKDLVELDIFLPDFNLAIEYDGLYWHSEFHGNKKNTYHLTKTQYCENNGIHLIHIFEDEWKLKQEIVKSRLKNILGFTETKIFARLCEIKEIPTNIRNEFLIKNHIQGQCNASYSYGLYYNSELVSVMVFSKLRKSLGNKQQEAGTFELIRYCNKLGVSVVGGAGKLLKYFEKIINPIKIVTFADRRWTNSKSETLYEKIGFTRVGTTQPNYWYMKGHSFRQHRYLFAKYRILQLFESADPNLSEWQNMINLGYDRIWDCGSIKFEKYNSIK